MWKINFFAVPVKESSSINPSNINRFINLAEFIDVNDEFYIPKEYYETEMSNGQNICEFCFSEGDEDVKTLFREFIFKSRISEESYEVLFNMCDNPTNETNVAMTGFENNQFLKNSILYTEDFLGVREVKRFYLGLCREYNEFASKIPFCFTNLTFLSESFDKIRKLGRLEDNINEIIRHLCVLNDYAKEIYIAENNENSTLQIIASKYNITCSGKGSNEGEFKIDYQLGNMIERLTCNPHTKLYDGNNDYRIYFCWGREAIEEGKIIIAKMGGHWE